MPIWGAKGRLSKLSFKLRFKYWFFNSVARPLLAAVGIRSGITIKVKINDEEMRRLENAIYQCRIYGISKQALLREYRNGLGDIVNSVDCIPEIVNRVYSPDYVQRGNTEWKEANS